MRTTSLRLLSCCVLTGCGHDAAKPDASPDSPPDVTPATKITVTTGDAPSLIAFRDGTTGPWLPPTHTSAGSSELDVHGPYQVVVVCDDGMGNITTLRASRTPDDDHTFDADCTVSTAPQATVQGTMVQAGRVAMGFSGEKSTTANWMFSLLVDQGTYDLGAVDTGHILFRRGVAASGTTTITPAIDVVKDGTALVPTVLTPQNTTANDTVTAIVRVLTPTTFLAVYNGNPATAPLIPASALTAADKQRVTMAADDGAGHFRELFRSPYTIGDSTTFAVPAPLGPVQFAVTGGTLGTTWSTLPDYDILDVSALAFSSDGSSSWFDDVEISHRFVTATGATTAALDTDIPGYKPAWRIDYTMPYDRVVTASKLSGNEIASSSFDDSSGGTALRRLHDRRMSTR